jgi:phage terminase large subunit GpA-like protein
MVINGDPLKPQVWKELDKALEQEFPPARWDRSESRGRVHRFRRRQNHRRRRTLIAKSVSRVGSTRRRAPVSGLPIVGPLKRPKRGCPLYRIGTDTAKAETYGRLRTEEPGPGTSIFPKEPKLGFDQNFFVGLTIEKPDSRI